MSKKMKRDPKIKYQYRPHDDERLARLQSENDHIRSQFLDCAGHNAKLRAALEEILSLQPLKTQHEHYIAMLKTLDIARKALANEQEKPSSTFEQDGLTENAGREGK